MKKKLTVILLCVCMALTLLPITAFASADIPADELCERNGGREEYAFTGWYADEGLTSKVTSLTLRADTTLYAAWRAAGFETPFHDVSQSDWFYESVMRAGEKGLMQGTGNGRFSPYLAASRAMIVAILWRLEGSPMLADYDTGFADLTQNWYADAVSWAHQQGIVAGCDETHFAPGDPITREQLASILYRYEQSRGGGFVGSWMFLLDFPDRADVSDWGYEGMCWCVMNGVIEGDGGRLLPKGNATRAQTAVMLARFLSVTAP